MDTIGSRIKEYRLQKGMTQQDIADALGESSGRVIYNWEKGTCMSRWTPSPQLKRYLEDEHRTRESESVKLLPSIGCSVVHR